MEEMDEMVGQSMFQRNWDDFQEERLVTAAPSAADFITGPIPGKVPEKVSQVTDEQVETFLKGKEVPHLCGITQKSINLFNEMAELGDFELEGRPLGKGKTMKQWCQHLLDDAGAVVHATDSGYCAKDLQDWKTMCRAADVHSQKKDDGATFEQRRKEYFAKKKNFYDKFDGPPAEQDEYWKAHSIKAFEEGGQKTTVDSNLGNEVAAALEARGD